MKAFVAHSEGVVVLNLVQAVKGPLQGVDLSEDVEMIPEYRKYLREGLKEIVPGATHVWFEDEMGTEYDPIGGPNPTYSPGLPGRPNMQVLEQSANHYEDN